MLERQIAGGCRQVVLLGAGLDTRAVRKAAPGVRYFEIDDADTMVLKATLFAERGIHPDARFIGANYVTDGMLSLLVAHGLDLDLPTFVIWEGNTMYLDEAADRAILAQLRDGLPFVRVSFDYFAQTMITRTTGDAGLTRMADNFSAMNAPWITGFDDIPALGADLGLRVVEDVTTATLVRVYRPGTPPPAFGPFYSIATLGSY
jgi:methyltransferase (TIGR00027 family)